MQIYGYFWLICDSLERLSSGKQYEVILKDADFRKAHMKCKNFLWS